MKKFRIIALLMAVMCLACAFTITPVSAADEYGDHFVVNGSDGFGALRSGPGSGYSMIKKIYNGDRITILSYNGGTGWYYVRHYTSNSSSDTGYMHSSVFRPLEYPTYGSMCTAYIVKTSGSNLNVRSSPGTSSSIIASIAPNTVVTVAFRYNADWYQVLYNGEVGYCSATFLKETPALLYKGNLLHYDYLVQAYEMINCNYYIQTVNGSRIWNSRDIYDIFYYYVNGEQQFHGIESLVAEYK